jgi:hypothetical protein
VREFTLNEVDTKGKTKGRRSAGGKRNLGETDISKSNDPKKAKVEPPNFHQLATDSTSKYSHTLPINFYEVAKQLFDEFWNLQFDNKEVDFAFFANITIHNCRDYGLTTFSEKSYSLTVINVRDHLKIDLLFFFSNYQFFSPSVRQSCLITIICHWMTFCMISISCLRIS